ncbi:hypothetical protein ACVRXQ_02960 [Streptococcus panodentis]|uniref:ASCH domain-containing protein n=1 Tax=Streptococcus panodentis TaxID=1581472 RepID=A0ABS5AZH1_9STRE|nr:hypothetical protein [Streptococcus panodentis]MBP2621960.1 hypothetical protein [Streptococcus panodentis]
MNEIILSFKPEFFRALLTGKKHFEYRARIPDEETIAYLYLSAPAKMIVGKMVLGKRNNIQDFLDKRRLKSSSCSNLEQHLNEGAKYFSSIHSLSLLDKPVLLEQAKQLSPTFHPPQGYTYIKNYRELHHFLDCSNFSTFEINSSDSLELLGLFTKDIVKVYKQEIATPVYLKQYI